MPVVTEVYSTVSDCITRILPSEVSVPGTGLCETVLCESRSSFAVARWIGAGDRIRTGDIDLGKVALYQLSYSRARGGKDPKGQL